MGGGDALLSADDAERDGGASGGDLVDETATALPARWMPAARARDVAGFARARCAAEKAAAAGIGDCMSAPSEAEVGPTRARRSGLDVKYLWRVCRQTRVVDILACSLVEKGEKRIFLVWREIGERHLQIRQYVE